MSSAQTNTMPTEKFLTIATNLLHRTLLNMPRTQAKTVYKEMRKGTVIHLTTLEMEDKSSVRYDVSLDHSEFYGSLNFSAFRSSLTVLVANLAQTLKEEKDITVFSAENDNNMMIFGIPAITQEGGESNVMVLSADVGSRQSTVLLRLMYLDRSQFAQQQKA